MTTLEADVKKDSTNGVKYDESVKKEVEVQIHGASNPTETHKPATLEVEAENGTTNQPEKIANGETTLMAKPNASDEEVIANAPGTGKSLSEALILGSTKPQYDERLFIDLPVEYMKTASQEHVVIINCSECQNKNQFLFSACSFHVLNW